MVFTIKRIALEFVISVALRSHGIIPPGDRFGTTDQESLEIRHREQPVRAIAIAQRFARALMS